MTAGSTAAPPRRRLARLAVVLTATGLLIPLAAGTASAAGPGSWSQLGVSNSIISTPDATRVGSDLQVVWTQDEGNTAGVYARTVNAAGGLDAGPSAVVSGWSTAVIDPQVVFDGATRTTIFSGIRSTNPGELYNGNNLYRVTSGNGASWALSPLQLTTGGSSAYGSYGTGAVVTPGGIVGAYTLNSDIQYSPAGTLSNGGCCAYYTSLVRDSATGAVWATWYSNATGRTGTWAQQIEPSVGPAIFAPGSATATGNAIAPDQAVAATSRDGGGIYIAYYVGYPSPKTIRVWRADTGAIVDVPAAGGVENVSLSHQGSRLWLSWTDDYDNVVFASRSNPEATVFGGVASAKGPGSAGTSLWSATSDGATGRLDVVVNATVGAVTSIYQTQLNPGLSIARPGKVKRGKTLKVKISDAGAVIKGAKVKLGTAVKKTNKKGVAAFKISGKKGNRTIVVSYAGFTKTKVKVKVT